MKQLIISIGLMTSVVACSSVDNVAKTEDGDRVLTQEELDAVGYECRMVKATTSRIKKKQCTTKAQRDYRTEKSKELLEKLKGPTRTRARVGG